MDQVVHFHLPVNDMERSKKFYSDIFGWEITQIPKHTQYQKVKTVDTDENEIPLEPGAINGALYVRESPEEYPELPFELLQQHIALDSFARNETVVWFRQRNSCSYL